MTETTDDGDSSGAEPEPRPDSAQVQDTAFASSWLANMATDDTVRLPRPAAATQLGISVLLLLVTGEISR